MDFGNDKLNGLVLKAGSLEAFATELSEAGIAYLLQYGFRQSINDVIAGMAKAMKAELVTDDDAEALALGLQPGERRWTDTEVVTALHDAQQERFDAIVQGTIGSPRVGTARGDIMSRTMSAIAVERLKAKLGKFKVALPTAEKTILVQGKPMSRADLVAAELAKYDADIRAEAERRIQVAKEAEAGAEELSI